MTVLSLFALVLSACSSGFTVRSDTHPEADFSHYRTYGFFDPMGIEGGYNTPVFGEHFRAALDREMASRGYRRSAEPDLLINVTIRADDQVSVRTRTGKFLTEMVDKHLNQMVIAITHGWTMNAFIDSIFNIGLYRSAYVNVDNTAITYVEYVTGTEFENWRVHFVGQTPHLDVFPGGLAPEGWEG